MKRHPSLQPLSDDHHRALVLARRLRKGPIGTTEAELAALSLEVQREFDAELEPHFRVEEQRLLPALEARGEAGLVEQTRADHARIRALVRHLASEDAFGELGTLLERHVRFEERVVFPRAEEVLSEGELAAVRAGCGSGSDGSG